MSIDHPAATTFGDRAYIAAILRFLRRVRLRQGLSLRRVARRARLRENLLRQAEAGRLIPRSADFKSWSRALGYSWDRVWRESSMSKSVR